LGRPTFRGVGCAGLACGLTGQPPILQPLQAPVLRNDDRRFRCEGFAPGTLRRAMDGGNSPPRAKASSIRESSSQSIFLASLK
jgi:hypothetical protein